MLVSAMGLLAMQSLVAVGTAGSQEPEGGALTYVECISSNTDVTPCTRIAGDAEDGSNTGLDALRSVAVSPDGTSVYTASSGGDAVAWFDRTDDGTLIHRDCITSNADVMGCTAIDGATEFGNNTGLNSLYSVAVSPDGASVYTASLLGDAVGRFDRADDGTLTYRDCVTSNADVDGCTPIDAAAEGGISTGLDGLVAVAVSPDGTSVVTASFSGDAVAWFDRADDGTLMYQACITSNTNVAGCTTIPGGSEDGINTGLDGLFAVKVSPDGTSVYTASQDGDAVAWFDRTDDGALIHRDCITSNSDVMGCTVIDVAAEGGTGTGLNFLLSVAVSPDGTSVVAASALGAVGRFDRADDGTLTYHGCIASSTTVEGCSTIDDATSAVDGLISVTVSPDGTSVYIASINSDFVSRFDRADDGTLTYRGCITSDTTAEGCNTIDDATEGGTNTGLDGLFSVAVSPDGTSVYTASLNGDAVGQFDRVLPPDPEPEPDPTDEPTEDPTEEPEPEVVRLAGPNRFGTAAEVALDGFEPADVDVVFLATGFDFPDALAGGPLAAANTAPILLTTVDTLPKETADALQTLAPDRVVALGGTAVLSDDLLAMAAAAARGADTDRVFGADRFATAAAVAEALGPSDTVFLATGLTFPDALAGSAATAGAPILLVTPTSLPEPTRQALAARTPDALVALGGTAAVSQQVLADAAAAAGGASTERLFGTDRFATAVDIAATFGTPDTVYVATGLDAPDALAGGPAAVTEAAPIVLVSNDTVPEVVHTYLDDLTGLRRIVILGGTAVVDDTVKTTLEGLLDP